jgi:hypothetical protein
LQAKSEAGGAVDSCTLVFNVQEQCTGIGQEEGSMERGGIEKLLENRLTAYGLRRVHVTRMGGAVDVEKWLGQVPEEAQDLGQRVWVEDVVGVHHLELTWQAREMVKIREEDASTGSANGERVVCLWYVGRSFYEPEKKSTIREAADWAGTLYRLKVGAWPVTCFVRQMPAGAAGQRVMVEDGSGSTTLAMTEAGWVPANFIAVG